MDEGSGEERAVRIDPDGGDGDAEKLADSRDWVGGPEVRKVGNRTKGSFLGGDGVEGRERDGAG